MTVELVIGVGFALAPKQVAGVVWDGGMSQTLLTEAARCIVAARQVAEMESLAELTDDIREGGT